MGITFNLRMNAIRVRPFCPPRERGDFPDGPGGSFPSDLRRALFKVARAVSPRSAPRATFVVIVPVGELSPADWQPEI